MTLTDFQNYLLALAQSHILLQHGNNGRVAFVALMSNDALDSLASRPNKYVLIVDNVSSNTEGTEVYSKIRQLFTLTVLGKVDNDEAHDTELQTVLQTTWDIAAQLLARMKYDFETDSCGPAKDIITNRASINVMEDAQLENHYGWQLTLPVWTSLPVYDAGQWV